MIDAFQHELYAEVRRSVESATWDVPPVPARLLNQVVGAGGTAEGFLYGGFMTALGLRAVLKLLGMRLAECGTVLDFGCGPARVLRWLGDIVPRHLYGADVNDEAIVWCRNSALDARFIHNTPFPPLPLADSTIDVAFAISVLTHLDEQHQLSWLRELRRVIRPNGVLLVTVHGRNKARRALDPIAYSQYAQNGFLFCRPHERLTLDGLPDFYQMAFHSREYIERTWSRFFQPLLYVSHGPMYEQELIALRKTRRARPLLREHRLPLAAVDRPQAGGTVRGREVHVSGWAFFLERRDQVTVDVWVDGRRIARCATGDARPDVGAAFRSRHAERSGFSTTVRLDTAGKRALWITAGDDPLPLAATFFATERPDPSG